MTPLFVEVLGLIDGANTAYTTPTPYAPSTLRVLLNGQLTSFDAIVETNPSSGAFLWVDPQPPRNGDKLIAFYLDVLSGGIEIVEVCPLVGVLDVEDALEGGLGELDSVVGAVEAEQTLTAFWGC